MSTTVESPVILFDGAPVIECSYENTVNSGVKWSAKVVGVRDIGGDAPSTHTISVDGWTSPVLVATESEFQSVGGFGTTTYAGIDLTSYMLGQEGLSLPTMHDMTGAAIVEAIAAAAGISVDLGGTMADMRVEDYDVQGGIIGEHIVRLLRDAACNYRIGVGGMEIFGLDTPPESTETVVVGSTQRKRSLAHLYTQAWCRKQSKGKGIATFPISKSGMGGGDLGTGMVGSSLRISLQPGGSGGLAYAAFYSQSGGNGPLVAYLALDPEFAVGGGSYAGVSALIGAPNPALVAHSCVFSVIPPPAGGAVNLTVVVRGRPPSSGENVYDQSFTMTHPEATLLTDDVTGVVTVTADNDTAARKRKLVVESPCWPTKDWMAANDIPRKLLAEANKATDTVSANVKFNPAIEPGASMALGDLPSARYDSVSWRAGSGGVSQTLTGWVVH